MRRCALRFCLDAESAPTSAGRPLVDRRTLGAPRGHGQTPQRPTECASADLNNRAFARQSLELTLAVNSRGALARRVGGSEARLRARGCVVARKPLARPALGSIVAAIVRPRADRPLPPDFSGSTAPRRCNFQQGDGSRARSGALLYTESDTITQIVAPMTVSREPSRSVL
jgi:hypothetical protein